MTPADVDSRKIRQGRFVFEAIRESKSTGTGDVESILVRRKNIGTYYIYKKFKK